MPMIIAGKNCFITHELTWALEYLPNLSFCRTTIWADFELPDQQYNGRKIWLGVRVLHIWERWVHLVHILDCSCV